MSRNFLFILVVQLFVTTGLLSQEKKLSVTEDFSKAVIKGTRTEIGVPGAQYWQNQADYEIMVNVVPEEQILRGQETITYFNNSPDKLGRLVFKIYQNLYQEGGARDIQVSKKDIHNGVDVTFHEETSDEFIDTLVESGTNLIVHLKDSIHSGDSIKLSLQWEMDIPGNTDVRMGAMNDSAFFLGFWYPRLAVYDDLDGWDMVPHTGNQEFYHDKGNYEVYIAVPEGYMVMATGMLQNAEVVLQDEYLERYHKALQSDSVVTVINKEDLSQVNSIFRKNVWIFKAEDVPDFAFGVSNHHQWDATSVLVDTASQEKVLVQCAYPSESEDFKEVAKFAKQTIQHLSFEFPGYPYPFPSVSIFNGTNGTSGMEYPMIANNPSAERRGRTLDVTAHEIAHNYLPFYILTNETQHAWMDEAFAAMLPYKLQEQIEPSLNRLTRYTKTVSRIANTKQHISTMAISSAISARTPYYFTNYTKPALALYYLEEMLGTETFKRALMEYFTVWQGKHPSPYDFFNLMNQSTDRELNWFWEPWFFDPAWPDLSILEIEEEVNSYKITIKKKGKLPVPVRLTIFFEDGTKFNVTKPADVWKDGDNHLVVPLKTNKKIKRILLGDEYVPDVYKEDNVYLINK